MVLAIDWDGVLHDRTKAKGGEFGPPLSDAANAMEELHDKGFRLVVHTCVAHTPSGYQAVTDWLEDNDIIFDEVTAVKPVATAYIDDRAVRHTSWTDTIHQLRMLGIYEDDE